MTLAPKLPPGRANRKALRFAADIHRLRSAGYTFSAIQMALLDAGIRVGLSTVKREAARRETPSLRVHQAGVAQLVPSTAAPAPTTTPTPAASATVPLAGVSTSGREIAEAFFNANPSNPLLRARKTL
jgi:pseudouridine-5'-phosphate glycosidase